MKDIEKKIRFIASKISTIPTLPTVISRMIEMVDNPNTNARRLARVISSDQSLTARILKMANSAFYGFSREISTVDTAIVVMGFNAVKEMGLSLSVFDAFKGVGSLNNFDVNRYWEHSISTAVASRMLARRLAVPNAEELFVAGLLHDIGKMIFIQYLPEDYNRIFSRGETEDISYYEAEMRSIGVMHSQIGAVVAERWHLPDRIVAGIKNHHSHKVSDVFALESVVVDTADFISHRAGLGNSGHRRDSAPDPFVIHQFEEHGMFLDEGLLDDFMTDMLMELDSSEMTDVFSR
ncbi:MAG: HDOD domain-containing protein [Fibrobacterota bacterium]